MNIDQILRWIKKSATITDLFAIEKEIVNQINEFKRESLKRDEECEYRTLWKQWKNDAQALVNHGYQISTAVETTYLNQSNLWIQRYGLNTCSVCDRDVNEYFEHVFDPQPICAECDPYMEDLYKTMEDELVILKKQKI